ncbi:hypothetical protein ACRALDRAFT_2047946 [Sodiomyces alcalophilus JCM 7366]|uniref:uncharacterized protein n=1 Tax=Sodiomyces alcalophilus JCM 7366 TaxID=591952 RepID=UPI0039B5BBEF
MGAEDKSQTKNQKSLEEVRTKYDVLVRVERVTRFHVSINALLRPLQDLPDHFFTLSTAGPQGSIDPSIHPFVHSTHPLLSLPQNFHLSSSKRMTESGPAAGLAPGRRLGLRYSSQVISIFGTKSRLIVPIVSCHLVTTQVDEPQWPPRSPREALLSTPGGRERLRRFANRTSPSPSPLGTGRSRPNLSRPTKTAAIDMEDQLVLDDDDDEETLQLKLQEIQARLRLKKLQSAKAKKIEANDSMESPRPEAALPSPRGTAQQRRPARPASQNTIEIPVSPVRRARPEPAVQTSPSRVLLGIDKGLTAKDISLKRAPSLRKNHGPQFGRQQGGLHQQQQQQTQTPGGYLQRSKPLNPNAVTQQQQFTDPPRPLTFNERLAAARTEEDGRHAQRVKVQKIRSKAVFGIGQKEIEDLRSKAVELPEVPEQAPEFSRDEVLAGEDASKSSAGMQRSNTAPSLGLASQPARDRPVQPNASRKKTPPDQVSEAEATAFEPYSSFHLSRRIVPHNVLTRNLSGKKIMVMKDLLRHVKSPNYELPDVEQDIVFFAVVGKRSEPKLHQARPDRNGVKQDRRGKYMIMTLVDFKFELELFLFNSGFTRFWKVREGTVIAILNPTIMPPPAGRADTGRFSLVVNSDEDKLIEVGMARDLGFCKSVKKDGNICGHWVNRKRTEFCEFHTNEAIKARRAMRVEVNAEAAYGRRKVNSYDIHIPTQKELRRGQYDRESQTHWFASKSLSSADLIDGVGKLVDRREKEENLKRRLVAQERERAIQTKLGKIGTGAGKEYMKQAESQQQAAVSASAAATANQVSSSVASSSSSTLPGASSTPHPLTSQPREAAPKLDARALGLIAPPGKEHVIHLGPIKRKRPESSQSGSTRTSSSLATDAGQGPKPGNGGFGWGGGLRDKLSRMKDGEKLVVLDPDRPPMRKKTRFVTEKGIREAGRESLGDGLPVAPGAVGQGGQARGGMVTLDDDDDDDELVILR